MTVFLRQLADVLDTKTIDVLFISDCGGNSVFGDMFRKRKLDENTMYIRVMVKASDILQEFGFCDVLRVVFVPGEYICLQGVSKWTQRTAFIKNGIPLQRPSTSCGCMYLHLVSSGTIVVSVGNLRSHSSLNGHQLCLLSDRDAIEH